MPLRFQWHPFTYSRFEDRNVLFNCEGYLLIRDLRIEMLFSIVEVTKF